jgi:hypothetical protein
MCGVAIRGRTSQQQHHSSGKTHACAACLLQTMCRNITAVVRQCPWLLAQVCGQPATVSHDSNDGGATFSAVYINTLQMKAARL